MKKMNVFLCILCAFSLIISCISINSVQIIKGEKGDRGERGQQGMAGLNGSDGKNGINGINGKDGVDGKDGIDGLTPYIKDDYWWIGDTNTGYKVGELPCYVETTIQTKVFDPDELSKITTFCYNNNVTAIKIKNKYYSNSGNTQWWLIPNVINEGSYYSGLYNKFTLIDAYNSQNEKIILISGTELEITYSVEEFISLGTYFGGNPLEITVVYTERQHIIQKAG